MEKVIVTRHVALIAYWIESGLACVSTPVLTHVSEPEQIAGKHVLGVLPLHLASAAVSVTELQLTVPPELRGVELTLPQLRQYSAGHATYIVSRLVDSDA